MKARNATKRHARKRSPEPAKPSTAAAATDSVPRVRVFEQGGQRHVGLDCTDRAAGYKLLMEAVGTTDRDFIDELLYQVANASARDNEPNESAANFMLSVIKAIKPKDQLEAMLAAQMAAVHMAMMRSSQYLAHVENIPQLDIGERVFNKMGRTFVAQMEALKRYRTGGEQKVTVQHVSVSEGGQAIVGNVTQSKPETTTEKRAASPPPALTDARTEQMPIINERKKPVSVPARRARQK